ncbi:hypothetical protein Bca52824_015558 [Brassica carinata]|uniref:Uncharacterized protein n=1 Tax=Brassica carinata TaxID=52824 RepID=A0A8X8B4G6_BRACI|nr:hypothetical protein Bca52824_015558 [Brassica carinata]
MPKQLKYQPSLQEPKAKTEDAERGSKRLALSIGRESVELPQIGFVSTIHKRFHREIKDRRIEQGISTFGFAKAEKKNECDLLRAEGRRGI